MENRELIIVSICLVVAMLMGVVIGQIMYQEVKVPGIAQKYYDRGVINAFDKVVSDIEESKGSFGIKTSNGIKWFIGDKFPLAHKSEGGEK